MTSESGNGRRPGGGIFYGWPIIAMSAVGLSMSLPTLFIFPFQAFMIPLEQTFGWSRTEISLGLSIVTIVNAFLAPVAGNLMDRFGARKVLIPSIALLGTSIASLFLLSAAIWHFYLIAVVIAAAGAAAAPLGYSRIIVDWFDRRRGLALGLGLSGVGLGGALMVRMAQAVITTAGWREAYLSLGFVALIICLPVVVLVLRNTPADVGSVPDGAPAENQAAATSGDNTAKFGYSAREVLGLGSFWLMLAAFFLIGLSVTGFIAHLQPMLIGRGVEPAAAAGVASSFFIALLFGRVFAGILMDRFFAPHVALAFLVGPVFGFVIFAMGAAGPLALLAAILIGLALGAEFDIIAYFTSRYFGRHSFGQIYGYLLALFQIGSSLGPVIMGRSFDLTGAYTMALWALGAFMAIACVLIAMLGPYPDLPTAGAKDGLAGPDTIG